MKKIIVSLFKHPMADSIAQRCEIEKGEIRIRHFPDGESYVQWESDVNEKEIIIVDSLNQPDPKIMPLLFAAQTARELGAKTITLVAPYLAYMRQDARFKKGEAITSNCFAALLSRYFDRLVTVDPHLHRHHHLSDIYSMNTHVVPSADAISKWLLQNIQKPLLIGPDSESRQWVSHIAAPLSAPMIILEKERLGDKDVRLSLPSLKNYTDHQIVLVDDIISSGATLLAVINLLKDEGFHAITCIGVHGIFSESAYQDLVSQGARVVTCNTITHLSNQIDLSHDLADFIRRTL